MATKRKTIMLILALGIGLGGCGEVILDAMTSSPDLVETFAELDCDGSGKLSHGELVAAAFIPNAPGAVIGAAAFSELDINKDGALDRREFIPLYGGSFEYASSCR